MSGSVENINVHLGEGKNVKSYALQFNKMINDYGFLSDKFFKIRLRAWDLPGTKLDSSKAQISKVDKFNQIMNLDLLYSGASFSVNHSHNWGSNNRGALAALTGIKEGANISALKDVKNLPSDVASALGSIKTSVGALASGNLQNLDDATKKMLQRNIQNPTFSTIDISNAYEGSAPLSFTITATLIAHEDPMRDVVLPCKILEYMSYPKLNTTNELQNLLRDFGYSAQETSEVNYDEDQWKKIRDGIFKVTNDEDGQQFAGDNGTALSARSRSGKPPPVWQVSFSNGLHSLNNCALTNVGVNYFGPWLAKPTPLNVEEELERLQNSDGSYGFNDVARGIYTSGEKITPTGKNDRDSQGKGGYPSYAEISLTFTDNFKYPFGEDVLKSIFGGINDVVHVR